MVPLLHGFAQPPTAWADVQAALGDRAVRPCPTPGHDPSLPVPATWDEAIEALARQLGPVDTVVGYSYGARLALGLLARDLAARAILIGVNPGLADPDERAARRDADAVWATRLRREGTAAFLDAWEAQPLFATQARVAPSVRARRRAARLDLPAGPLADSLERLGLGAMPDLWSALLARASRACLVVGADDNRFRSIALDARRRAPALAVELVEGSGHDPTLEAPARLADVLRPRL